MIVFDIESDGLLDTITKVHCINAIDTESNEELRFTDEEEYRDPRTGELTGEKTPRTGTIADGLKLLAEADRIAGHNIVKYDVPALRIVYPEWDTKADLFDTKLLSQLAWPNLEDLDHARLRKGRYRKDFPRHLIGRHKLEAWGHRMGDYKDDFKPSKYGFDSWADLPFSKDMDDYCMQDVRVTLRLAKLIHDKDIPRTAVELETRFTELMARQEAWGWLFDEDAAEALAGRLMARREELRAACVEAFGCWYVPKEEFVPKRSNKTVGYVQGVPFTKVELKEFSPSSRQKVADRLIKVHGWEPAEFTETGLPKVDETILESLPYPEAKLIAEFLMVDKRVGQLAEGNQAWLKKVGPDGRIHGSVDPLGTVTRRCSHSYPNLAQVPANHAPYGEECRRLFIVPPGYKLVGCDADALELRVLAHFMARYDGGEYARVILEGRKEDGTDMHSRNQRVVGLNTRDNAKTWFYAFLYGAGDEKLGTIVVDDMDEAKRERFFEKYPAGHLRQKALRRLGKRSRDRIMEGLPALGQLVEKVKSLAKKRGYLKALDGAKLHVRSAHAALNTLCQSAGALVMKQALIIADSSLQVEGLVPGKDYEWVGNIHDEFQAEVKEEHAETVGRIAAESIRLAGEHFNFRVQLAGNYDIGTSWAETH